MASGNSFSQLLIVNGQPVLIKDIELNSAESISTDILQQAINDVSASGSMASAISCSNNNTELNSDFIMSVVEDCTPENDYVSTADQNVENTSIIRLSLEQASELGIHFSMDHLSPNLDLASTNKVVSDSNVSNTNQYSVTNSESHLSNDTTCLKVLAGNLDHRNVNLSNGNDNLLDPFHTISTSDQELTLVPHIVNGTVTYTLQLSNQMLQQSSNNELLQITDESVMVRDAPTSHDTLRFDLGSLSENSSEIPFISSLEIVPGKLTKKSAGDIPVTNERYNTENVTFLNVSDDLSLVPTLSSTVQSSHNSSSIPQLQKLSNNLGNFSNTISKNTKPHSNVYNGIRLIKNRPNILEKVKSNPDHCSPQKTHRSIGSTNSITDLQVTKLQSNKCFKECRKTQINGLLSPNSLLTSSISEKRSIDKQNTDTRESDTRTPTIITPDGGEVPKEVSVALSRIPIKSNSNKPLGSNENPIKLVQQGSTFHSMQALTEEHISKITPILQEKFDGSTTSKNVVYDPASNTRIIYRIISPSEVQLRKQTECPRRRGRPKKVQSDEVDGAPPPKKLFPRTRSGRLSRPPKHMVRDYKHIRRPGANDSDGGYSDYQSDNEMDVLQNINTSPVELLPGLVATQRKTNKRNISAGNLCPTCGKIYFGYMRMKRHFDKYPDHGSIEYLNSIRNSNPDSEAENNNGNGLWRKGCGRKKGRGGNNSLSDKRSRLKEAVEWCESEMVADIAGPTVAGALSLWQLLLLRLDSVKCDSRVAMLYQELCQLLTTLRRMAHKLFRPLDHPLPAGAKPVTVQVEDEIMAEMLNLPCGVYLASDEDLDKSASSKSHGLQSPPQETQIAPAQIPMIEEKSQGSRVGEAKEKVNKIEIEEVPQPFLEEMICDSGLMNVDEIVSERLQNFTSNQPSSVDELMKGLNELEQRNKLESDDLMEEFSIVSRRTHVSASTEDLMKSLEHFESDLSHSEAPSNLEDRDTFDRVTNVDTLDFEVLSREFHSNNR